MDKLSTWELIECARINLKNYRNTMSKAFLDLADEQLKTASEQAEAEETIEGE